MLRAQESWEFKRNYHLILMKVFFTRKQRMNLFHKRTLSMNERNCIFSVALYTSTISLFRNLPTPHPPCASLEQCCPRKNHKRQPTNVEVHFEWRKIFIDFNSWIISTTNLISSSARISTINFWKSHAPLLSFDPHEQPNFPWLCLDLVLYIPHSIFMCRLGRVSVWVCMCVCAYRCQILFIAFHFRSTVWLQLLESQPHPQIGV